MLITCIVKFLRNGPVYSSLPIKMTMMIGCSLTDVYWTLRPIWKVNIRLLPDMKPQPRCLALTKSSSNIYSRILWTCQNAGRIISWMSSVSYRTRVAATSIKSKIYTSGSNAWEYQTPTPKAWSEKLPILQHFQYSCSHITGKYSREIPWYSMLVTKNTLGTNRRSACGLRLCNYEAKSILALNTTKIFGNSSSILLAFVKSTLKWFITSYWSSIRKSSPCNMSKISFGRWILNWRLKHQILPLRIYYGTVFCRSDMPMAKSGFVHRLKSLQLSTIRN